MKVSSRGMQPSSKAPKEKRTQKKKMATNGPGEGGGTSSTRKCLFLFFSSSARVGSFNGHQRLHLAHRKKGVGRQSAVTHRPHTKTWNVNRVALSRLPPPTHFVPNPRTARGCRNVMNRCVRSHRRPGHLTELLSTSSSFLVGRPPGSA